METVVPAIQSGVDGSPESNRKKRKKAEAAAGGRSGSLAAGREDRGRGAKRWRTEREQQIYSSKLVEALRRSRRSSAGPSEARTSAARGKEIRQTANKVLAASARGTTLWSRAILASRARAAAMRKRQRKARAKKSGGGGRDGGMSWTGPAARRPLASVARKVKVLGRLVPGCRKIPLTNLLEEASDYIAALEMQVRAMTALTELLGGGGGGGSAPPAPT